MTFSHHASVRLEVPMDFAFQQLSDGRKLGRWTLGSMGLEPLGATGRWRGASLFDGALTEVEIRPHPELGLIDFLLGAAEASVPRVSIRVVAGPDWGLPESACLVAMSTWRASWMSDARWERTRRSHELEVLLFKAQIEAEWAGR